MYMKTRLVFLVMFWSLLAVAYGQTEFEKKVYVTASGDSLNYRLLRPEVEQEGDSSCMEQVSEVRTTRSNCFMEVRCGSIR